MHKYFAHFAILICFAVLLGALSGCTTGQNTPNEMDICFTDALGRNVSVPKQPQRVAALIGSFADVWLLAGGTLCATADDAWEDFGLELPDALNIGGAHSPNLELLFAADPELVIASASTASHVQFKDTLEAAGIPVIYFDVDNFQDYLEMLLICTRITGREDLYEANGLAIAAQIDGIKAQFAENALPAERRTVLLLRAHSGTVKAKGSEGTILGEMLADLGCINIADSDHALLENLSVERVIQQEPYRIFVVTMGNDTQKALENLSQMMAENPAWGTLECVREGRLHIMDRKLFNIKPNENWAISYEKLRDILLADQ